MNNIQDTLSCRVLNHKETFLGKISDWIGKPVPRENYFTFTPLKENDNHKELRLKYNLSQGVQYTLLV